jgi:DNA-directed RNA polymerase specialized sigma24 family protein
MPHNSAETYALLRVLREPVLLAYAEIAEGPGITEGAVQVRHFRALECSHGLWDEQGREERP